MYQAEYPGINTFLRDTCRLILEEGVLRETRGMKCFELPEPIMIKITDPTARIITIPERKWYAPLAYAESLWLASGRNDMAFINRYSSNMHNFSDDNETMRGGYGPRLRHFNGAMIDYDVREVRGEMHSETDQFRYVVECFKKDIHTRQAIITIGDPMKDCFDSDRNLKRTKDVPCTRLLHFVKDAKDEKLNLVVTMRSNDLIWGASAVNIFNFTFMQEYFAAILGLQIGSYYHIVNNLHYYEDKRQMVEDIASVVDITEAPYKYQKSFKNLDQLDNLIFELSNEEAQMHKEGYKYHFFNDEFFRDWYNVLYHKNIKRETGFLNKSLNRL